MHQERTSERGAISGLVIGAVVAAALIAVPLVLMTRMQGESAEQVVGEIEAAEDARAQLELTNAMRAAQTYFSERGSFAGFDPSIASSFEPGIRFNGAAEAVRGEISIRAVTPTTVVLVTKAGPGAFLCSAAEQTTVTTGRVEAASVADCEGGW